MALEKEVPYCTIFLVIAALACHTLVLTGNLATSRAMADLGKSTEGWSNVGLGLAGSLSSELDELLANTTETLTKTLKTISEVQEIVDMVVSGSGDATDVALSKAALVSTGASPNPSLLSIDNSSMEAEVQVMKLINDCYVEPIASSPIDLVSILADTDHSDKMFKCLENHPVPGVNASDASFDGKTAGEMLFTYTQTVAAYVKDDANAADKFKSDLKKMIKAIVDKMMAFLIEKMDEFLVNIRPALEQIGEWLISFGDKIQAVIEGFSTTLDIVQKMFDQIMGKMSSSAGEGFDQMVYDTITLFDTSNAGSITAEDLKSVATIYGVSSLDGEKSDALFEKFDADGSGNLSQAEYERLVVDDSVPGIMPVVLRAFSKKLSGISGNVAAGKMRDEVADTVAQYLTLICAKNYTKVQWVSERLTNASIPMEFTADLMKQLAMNMDSPDKLTDADVGAIIVGEMFRQNKKYVQATMKLMSTPEFWASEGFDPDDQPGVLEQVTKWVSAAHCVTLGTQNDCTKAGCRWDGECQISAVGASLLQLSQGERQAVQMRQSLPAMARQAAARRQARFWHERRRKQAEKQASLFQSVSAHSLRLNLLGGVGMSSGGAKKDPALEMAINSGQPAVPATLEFAKFLAWNASDTADRFQDQCFDYSGESSSSLDSFADSIQAMIKKIQGFLNLMEEYSTPDGIQRLEGMVHNFAVTGANDVTRILGEQVDKFDLDNGKHPNTTGTSLLVNDPEGISDTWIELNSLLSNLMTALPSVLANLKDARKQVSTASSGMSSIFGVFQEKGKPIFDEVSGLYAYIWTAYFILFVFLTTSVLFYGFWASGWFGSGVEIPADADYEPPQGCVARLGACCRSCGACLRGCHDTALCFWSFILLFQVVVLILFLVSILLCLLAGVKAFMAAGCGQIYFINDESVCQGVLDMVQTFLKSFWQDNVSELETACSSETLLACQLIGSRLQTYSMYTVVGSTLASVVTFQMIIDSAILHERARWRKIFDGDEKS